MPKRMGTRFRFATAFVFFSFQAVAAVGPVGASARYTYAGSTELPASSPRQFTVTLGAVEGSRQWVALDVNRFQVQVLTSAWPPAQESVARYILAEANGPAKEFRNAVTGEAVLPVVGGWEYLFPRGTGGVFPANVRYLGHPFRREWEGQGAVPTVSGDTKTVALRPDLLIGPASNTRQKDERRRWDDSDYELVPLTRADYAEMAEAGISCVRVDAKQAAWADELGLFYWGVTKELPYPELLYRSQYLGSILYLDEPAVSTRDHVIRPRMEKDPAYRKAMSPQLAFEAFKGYYKESMERNPQLMIKQLRERKDIDLGDMHFAQENIYSWETMVSTAAYQLSRDAKVPAAFVFEPPGRIGSRRTLPEMNMTYGTHYSIDDQRAFADIIFGFLRGAARQNNKAWGISIYGAVQQADAPVWMTHAYNLGATRFYFWDNYQLACVPYGEVLALARHLKNHAAANPRRNLDQLRKRATTAILLPVGYDLGHVMTGKGNLWGIPELNLERTNRLGVKHRVVMSNFFQEVERAVKADVPVDFLWDLPDAKVTGYGEVVRIREDGKVEVAGTVLDKARAVAGPAGEAPGIAITVSAKTDGKALQVDAQATVTERAAPVYYTLGADPRGVYNNAMVAFELYGPESEDHRFLPLERMKPRVRRTSDSTAVVDMSMKVDKPGTYRLRAATVDVNGRTAVVWKRFAVAGDAATGSLTMRPLPLY